MFDRYQRQWPRQRTQAPVTVVAVDEQSLRQLGQWPWPRDQVAALVDAVNAYQPLVIGFDILFVEPDTSSPEALAARLPAGDRGLKAELLRLPAHDDQLAAALKRGPAVLAAAGFDAPSPGTRTEVRHWPVLTNEPAPGEKVRHYPHVLGSLDIFQAAASGQGVLNTDLERGVVRRVDLLSRIGDALVPTLGVEMLRVAQGAPAMRLTADSAGMRSLRIGELDVPTEANGQVWLHFGRFDPHRYVSASDVLAGNVAPDVLRDSMVIVALTGMGLMDYKTTPLGDYLPGVEAHVQLIENLVSQHPLRRSEWQRWLEMALFAAGGLFVIQLLPQVRPRTATLAVPLTLLLIQGGGVVAYLGFNRLIDTATLSLASLLVLGTLIGSRMLESDRERREIALRLQQEREAAARTAGELEAARNIQLGTLPKASDLIDPGHRFEIAALLEPARSVGGDLYDFFMFDERRLLFAVGDVSGKGVPAALFMVVAKALQKSIALRRRRGDPAPGEILLGMDVELSRENPASLFVTAVCGILDVDTGVLRLANAGHDAPWCLRADGRLDVLQVAGGPPLCALEGFPYDTVEFQLQPGDMLVVSTDGVTEALDNGLRLYGSERFKAVLGGLTGCSPDGVLSHVHDDLMRFVDGAEQADDITLLAILWNGPTGILSTPTPTPTPT